MGLCILMLGTLWFAQIQGANVQTLSPVAPEPLRPIDGSSPARSSPTFRAEQDSGSRRGGSTGQSAASSIPRQAIAQEMASTLFAAPLSGSLAGRPTTLLEALGRTADRSQQAAVARAYWRLAAAVGEYHAKFLAVERLQRISPRTEDVSALRFQRALAVEALLQARERAARAQRALAEVAGWSFSAPLPADAPHAGPYRTGLNESLASATFPARHRLVHRVLPLRRQGIELRAAAVQAAEDALEAALDAYRESGVDFAVVLSCVARAVEQREGFVAEVCAYNEEIAEFALSVAPPDASARALVSMMIVPASPGSASSRPAENVASPPNLPAKRAAVAPATGVEAASAVLPASPWEPDVVPASPRQPTLAPPKPKPPEAIPDEPLPLPPKPAPEYTAKRAPIADRTAGNLSKSSALYPALVSASAIGRVQDLAAALHWDRRLPSEAGRTTELEECLRGVSSGDRRSVIEAYWTARERVAVYQVFAEQGDLIEQLAPLVLDHRQQPTGPLDMLHLRAARLAIDAARSAAQVELLRAQFELTQRTGRPLNDVWLLPATAPHAGPYRLKLEEQKAEIVQQPLVKRLAAAVPALFDVLQQRAGAVVEADAARAAATAAYESSGRGMEPVLAAMRWQTAETLAFLQTLTAYNQAIADYALTVLPSAIPGDHLVPALVLTRR